MKYPVVLFDLDGTLLDTTNLILASFRHTLQQFGLSSHTDETIRASLGEPLAVQMRRLGGAERMEAMVETYRRHNLAHHDDYVTAFPGVETVLHTLHREGVLLGVVSNKQRITVEKGLDWCGLTSLMATIVCQGEADRDKPAPDPILLALDQVGMEPAQALMVGDSRYDLLAAKEAGVASAAVAWSAHGVESLLAYRPEYTLQGMEDLYPILGLAHANGGGHS